MVNVRSLLVLAAIILVQFSAAQYAYQLYSPPQNPSGGGYSGRFTAPYSLSGGIYGGGGPGPGSCSGAVTYAYTLKPGMQAPQVVYEALTSNAGWVGTPGAADNGQSDPDVLFYPPNSNVATSGTSSGTHYKIVNNPGSGFTVNLSPNSSSPNGSCSASTKVGISEIAIVLTGIAGPKNNILMGQRLGGSITVNGQQASNPNDRFTWNISGDGQFSSYNVNNGSTSPITDAASVVPLQNPQTSSSFYAYFRKPTSFTISCTYFSASLNQTFNLRTGGTVYGPYCTWGAYIFEPELLDMNSNPSTVSPVMVQLMSLYGAGIIFQGSVTTPSAYTNQGASWWNYVQLATVSRTVDNLTPYDTRSSPLQISPINGSQVLDTSFPYETPMGVVYDFQHDYDAPADGSVINPHKPSDPNYSIQDGTWTDSPRQRLRVLGGGIPAPNIAHETVDNDSFHCYMLYFPPGPSQYVPLKDLVWYSAADVAIGANDSAWHFNSQSAGWSFVSDYPAHPTWPHRLDTTYWAWH